MPALAHYEEELTSLRRQLATCRNEEVAKKLRADVESYTLYVEVLRRQAGS